MLAPHTVVPLMQSNRMIVDTASRIHDTLEISISLVTIQLELQCLHTVYGSMAIDRLTINYGTGV